jgi:hypothetical protein
MRTDLSFWLGYSFVDRWLLYVKGGAAWTNEKVDDAFTNVRGIAVDPSTSTTTQSATEDYSILRGSKRKSFHRASLGVGAAGPSALVMAAIASRRHGIMVW